MFNSAGPVYVVQSNPRKTPKSTVHDPEGIESDNQASFRHAIANPHQVMYTQSNDEKSEGR